jgi:hypothetical protein
MSDGDILDASHYSLTTVAFPSITCGTVSVDGNPLLWRAAQEMGDEAG